MPSAILITEACDACFVRNAEDGPLTTGLGGGVGGRDAAQLLLSELLVESMLDVERRGADGHSAPMILSRLSSASAGSLLGVEYAEPLTDCALVVTLTTNAEEAAEGCGDGDCALRVLRVGLALDGVGGTERALGEL